MNVIQGADGLLHPANSIEMTVALDDLDLKRIDLGAGKSDDLLEAKGSLEKRFGDGESLKRNIGKSIPAYYLQHVWVQRMESCVFRVSQVFIEALGDEALDRWNRLE